MLMAFARAATLAMLIPSIANAAEIQIKMLNKGAEGMMVFEPSFVKASIGDTIKFIAVDRGHNVEAVAAMWPEGAASFEGKMDEEIVFTLDKPGVYGLRCKPHYSMGMVALVVAGDPVNAEKAKAAVHPGLAKPRFAALFAKLAAEFPKP